MEIKVYKIKDKRPEDGQECWVSRFVGGKNDYPTLQVYNAHYEVWDDSEGDDYDFDLTGDDLWMALPGWKKMGEEYTNSK